MARLERAADRLPGGGAQPQGEDAAGGGLWLATDVDDYPDHARRVLAAEGWAEAPCAEVLASARCPPWRRPSTKYERRIAAGRDVCDVCWRCEVD